MSLAPDEKYCPSCGNTVKKAAEWCPNCGINSKSTDLSSQRTTIYCETCGEEIHADTEICPGCGVRQQSNTSTTISGTYSNVTIPEIEYNSRNIWYYFQWIIGAFFLLGSIGAFTDPETGIAVSLITGLLMAGIGLAAIPQVRNHVSKEHSITTFGRIQNVKEESVKNPSNLCSACYGDIENGVRREFGSDLVIAGLVLQRSVDGVNHYCRECLKIEEGPVKEHMEEEDSLSD